MIIRMESKVPPYHCMIEEEVCPQVADLTRVERWRGVQLIMMLCEGVDPFGVVRQVFIPLHPFKTLRVVVMKTMPPRVAVSLLHGSCKHIRSIVKTRMEHLTADRAVEDECLVDHP